MSLQLESACFLMTTSAAEPSVGRADGLDRVGGTWQAPPGCDVIEFNTNWSKRIADDGLAKAVIEALWDRRRSHSVHSSKAGPKSRTRAPAFDGEAGLRMFEHFGGFLAMTTTSRELRFDPFGTVRLNFIKNAAGKVAAGKIRLARQAIFQVIDPVEVAQYVPLGAGDLWPGATRHIDGLHDPRGLPRSGA